MKNSEDILKELNEVAPLLAKTAKKNLVAVPENYFSAFQSNLMQEIRRQEVTNELETIAPLLSKIEKESLPQVPAYYFSAFPAQMLKLVSVQQKTNKVAGVPNWLEGLNAVLENITAVVFKPKYSFAYVGTVALVITGVMMFTKVEECTDLECRFAKLSNEDLNTYFEKNPDEVYHDMLDNVGEENATAKAPELNHSMLKEVTDEELNNAILD
jgi:hypothetical protein